MEDYLPDLPAHLTEGTNVARVYLHVRDGIISGALRSGDKLGEAALAAELGVSRTPVREALRNLAADGYIEVRPHAGAMVRRWDPDEVNSSFEVRADIEGTAAYRCAERITAHDLLELEQLCDGMEASDDATVRSGLNRTLHMRILRISGVAHAEKIVTQLTDLAILTMTYRQFSDEDTARSDGDHRLLMRAFRLRDGPLAQATMRVHILSAAATLEERRRGLR
ncbi:GntR family transcriptional regulator [Salipiger thiooxidans]|uniref:GntR family transcriptional regulator n=1 Tax=Salipiger thiooxidans TaxID=282683 RepID=UPI001A8FE96D|nr:GntR family transcriptional regulator [Salipiger thiooxidans]MBN8188188.1 GntR family transcriptional regulator [Salipiger thiooxidans]